MFYVNDLVLYMYVHAVWNELEKENKEFFEAYAQSKSKNDDRMSEEETSQTIQNMISSSQSESESSNNKDSED